MAKRKSESNLFKWKHFKGDIILRTVHWYYCYALYADLKKMAVERGLSIERSIIYRWRDEYGVELAKSTKPYLLVDKFKRLSPRIFYDPIRNLTKISKNI
jgi:transposase-like protein